MSRGLVHCMAFEAVLANRIRAFGNLDILTLVTHWKHLATPLCFLGLPNIITLSGKA